METLNYTTTQINRNFLIKVAGHNGDGVRLNTLVGVRGLLSLIDAALANRLLKRAFGDGADRTVCRLRRGLRITFYMH